MTQRGPWLGTRRDHGPRHLLETIVAFAVTVIAIRVYLDAAGYPKVGGGGLHVAHLLWGGLALVVAVLLVQLLVGRRALRVASVLAGIGVGLFIDEVGKFLTESNDYFFAPAAPIIYGAILLLVVLWLALRRERSPSPLDATHAAIEALHDAADARLTRAGQERTVARLRAAGVDDRDDTLPGALLGLLRSPEVERTLTAADDPLAAGSRLLRRLLPDVVERWLVRLGLVVWVFVSLLAMVVAVAVLSGVPVPSEVAGSPIEYPDDPVWLLLLAGIWIVVGLLNGAALVLDLVGSHVRGMALAQLAVLVGLVAGGLLNLYVSQLGALLGILLQVALLGLIIDRRDRLAAGVTSIAPAPSAGATA